MAGKNNLHNLDVPGAESISDNDQEFPWMQIYRAEQKAKAERDEKAKIAAFVKARYKSPSKGAAKK